MIGGPVTRLVIIRALVTLALALTVPAAGAAGSAGENSDDPRFWLERLESALTKTSYMGVFVYARGDQVSSMQIAHRYHNGMIEERLVPQDGEVGEIVRKGMDVVCVLPEHGRMELNSAIPAGPFAEAFTNRLMPVDRWYRPEITGRDRIAGHDVVRLSLTARDSLRYSHQLWLEESTALPLKGRVMSESGDILEYFHFTSLTISDSLPDREFEVQTKGREVSRTLAPQSTEESKQGMEGWTLGWRPDGFEPAAAPRSGSGKAVAFSDGLASFSLFVETGSGAGMPLGTSRIGATTVYMQRMEKNAEDFLVTVVGEIPLETALKVVESVEIEDSAALGAAQP